MEKRKLLEKALELLYDIGIVLNSVTFDGASVNLSMCTHLGVNFNINQNFKPYILHTLTHGKIFWFYILATY